MFKIKKNIVNYVNIEKYIIHIKGMQKLEILILILI